MKFKRLKKLVSSGVFNELPPEQYRVDEAFSKGLYAGRPGVDIANALPYLNDKQMNQIAFLMAKGYPKEPPLDHVGYAVCIRYIFGVVEKNGSLRSDVDSRDWEISNKFLFKFLKCLESDKNYYGQCIYYEMAAHRLGDLAVINNDISLLNKALDHYRKSNYFSLKCSSYKNIFSSIYWGAEYLNKMNDPRSIDWAMESLHLMEQYCPSNRYGYKAKAYAAMKIIYKNDRSKWDEIIDFIRNSKRQPIQKAFKKMRTYILPLNSEELIILKKIKHIIEGKKQIDEKDIKKINGLISSRSASEQMLKVEGALKSTNLDELWDIIKANNV